MLKNNNFESKEETLGNIYRHEATAVLKQSSAQLSPQCTGKTSYISCTTEYLSHRMSQPVFSQYAPTHLHFRH